MSAICEHGIDLGKEQCKACASDYSALIDEYEDAPVTLDCGCVLDRPFSDKSVTLRFCKVHEAATELLEACHNARAWMGKAPDKADDTPHSNSVRALIEQLDAALSKAKGPSSPPESTDWPPADMTKEEIVAELNHRFGLSVEFDMPGEGFTVLESHGDPVEGHTLRGRAFDLVTELERRTT